MEARTGQNSEVDLVDYLLSLDMEGMFELSSALDAMIRKGSTKPNTFLSLKEMKANGLNEEIIGYIRAGDRDKTVFSIRLKSKRITLIRGIIYWQICRQSIHPKQTPENDDMATREVIKNCLLRGEIPNLNNNPYPPNPPQTIIPDPTQISPPPSESG